MLIALNPAQQFGVLHKYWLVPVNEKNDGKKQMTEFWEENFREKQDMWGWEPVDSAVSIAKLFQERGFKHILIPGFGYGRNAMPFLNHGMKVTGIEISETAIDLAKRRFGNLMPVYHGPASAMPFDQIAYDGIFCYALHQLLEENESKKLIRDCYTQLKPDGYMVFITLSKSDKRYGDGIKTSKDTFETKHGVRLFFYDTESVKEDFDQYGLTEITEIKEPINDHEKKPAQYFLPLLTD